MSTEYFIKNCVFICNEISEQLDPNQLNTGYSIVLNRINLTSENRTV